MSDFSEKDYDAVEKAAFEKSMCAHIQEHGYKMADLMYDVFKCQDQLSHMKHALVEAGYMQFIEGDWKMRLERFVAPKPESKSKPEKK